MNKKKLFRLYREEGLAVRRRRGRKLPTGTRAPMALPDGPNQRWSLGFVSDSLSWGRRFRILCIVDDFRRRDECLNEEVFATLAEPRAVIERWRIDYNHVRPHSAHGGLPPEAVRLNPAAVRLRNLISSAARPLPSAKQIGYQSPGLSE